MKITAVITYCTNDSRFLSPCIEAVKPFCQQILVVHSDHFFDGTPENRDKLSAAHHAHPGVTFIEYPYSETEPFGLYCPYRPGEVGWIRYWIATSRYIGLVHARQSDYVLFIDVDEIIDTKRFMQWLQSGALSPLEMVQFASYLYIRDPSLRAKDHHQTSALLIKTGVLQPTAMLNYYERSGVFYHFNGPKQRFVLGIDGRPMVHHYHWVRTKEELLKKVASWGHRDDKNWKEIIESGHLEELTGYPYEKVTPLHNLFPTPLHLTPTAVRHLEIDHFKNN